MKISVPELSLILLLGPSGSGKTTFARRHFKETEVLSSDSFRALVSGDASDQAATADAFEVLNLILKKRLARGLLTVIDATNLQVGARKNLLVLAKEFHVFPAIIAFELDEGICLERNRLRSDGARPTHVLKAQFAQMSNVLKRLENEGFRYIFRLRSEDVIDAVTIERQKMWSDFREEKGPFDIIGDIHGCRLELDLLMRKLGYEFLDKDSVQAPEGRRVVFLGDLVDRGPDTPGVLRLVMNMVERGQAFCVPGNHDFKLVKKLRGQKVKVNHGLQESLDQLAHESEEFRDQIVAFVDGLVSHRILDEGRLVVAHAGLKESMQGRGSGQVRSFALYGETTGEIDEYGLPVRLNWAAEYRGKSMVVYGHTPVPEAEWLNYTLNIDTGCVFGGKLTALRYPEKELVSVAAAQVYCVPTKPLMSHGHPSVGTDPLDTLLDLKDFTGRKTIETTTGKSISIGEERVAAAVEQLSRFALDPRCLIYLPPTMAPSPTASETGYLEHPREAFNFFEKRGISKVICEEKHMGSRAVLIMGRDETSLKNRFGLASNAIGICYTRTGRRFFQDPQLEQQFFQRIHAVLTAREFWKRLSTDWICLDCELMPWSLKAQDLVESQYAAVGKAATLDLQASMVSMGMAIERGLPLTEALAHQEQRLRLVEKYVAAYQRYCWPVSSVSDIRLAPFHILASEGTTYTDKDHIWHMETLADLWRGDEEILQTTKCLVLDPKNPDDVSRGIHWWESLTTLGGEGMVVKPVDFIPQGPNGMIQPALKVRGREYLRIIYGPEYTMDGNLERLRRRSLSMKHSLAMREFMLSLEALDRFVKREPLRRVHECIVGILGLESEAIDPRL